MHMWKSQHLRRWLIGRPVAAIATIVFAVAALNGGIWSYLTPPFQVPDETAHFAYTQSIVENGAKPGAPDRREFSSEHRETLDAINTLGIIGRPLVRTPRDASVVGPALRAAEGSPRDDGGGPSTASAQPPLYYSAASVPYLLLKGESLLTRLHGMRFMSVGMFALSCGLVALFVAEILPGRSWAPLVGGLGVALSPYTAFIASGVTPDTLMMLASTATLLLTARAFRHGLTARRASGIALAVGVGITTKLTYLAFVPPTIIVVCYLAVRDRHQFERTRGGAVTVVLTAALVAAILPVISAVWARLTVSPGSSAGNVVASAVGVSRPANLREVAVYGWELFLPRLPFMAPQFEYSPPLSTWIDGFAGRYGWLDYSAPSLVASAFRISIASLAGLLLLSLLSRRRSLYRRGAELVAYSSFALALAAVIAKTGYDYRKGTGYTFEQPRYLLGLAAFYGAFLAVACIALGKRMAPRLAIVLIGAVSMHNLTGLMLTAGRYYL